MAGLPWLKVYTDLPRDHRSLVLGDMLGDPRAWTYVIQFRMYLADNAPSGRLSGPYAEVAFERCAGWAGERGRLLKAMRDAGFVRAGPARDGEGTEIEDVDWANEQGAHIAKFERDAKKPRGNVRNVDGPARDIGGTSAGPAQTPSGESRELRVESREERKDLPPPASASAAPEQAGLPGVVAPTPPAKPAKKAKEAKKPEPAPDPKPFTVACDMLTRVYAEVRNADYGFGLNATRNGKAVRELLWGDGAKGQERGEPLVPIAELERRWRIGLAWKGFPACNAIWDLKDNWAAYSQAQGGGGEPAPVVPIRRLVEM